MKRITLIRHAETDANAAGVWQGHGNADLSALGRRQAAALGAVFADSEVSRFISSDLQRTLETAHLAGFDPTADAGWREMDIGAWEGMTRDQVHERYPDAVLAMASGEDIQLGGGETGTAFSARVWHAFEGLVEQMHDGERAVVMTHGGVVHSIVSSVFRHGGAPRVRLALDRPRNTSRTEIVVSAHGILVETYNDATHLPYGEAATPLVSLIRHGESEANVRGEWHGRTDGPLSPTGRTQSETLPGRVVDVSKVYSSPLMRARDTAAPLAAARGLEVEARDDLAEMFIGEWEGLTAEAIAQRFPQQWAAVIEHGVDEPRGGTGETMAATAGRGRLAIDEIAARHRDERVAVVTHGMLMRAVVGDVLGVGWRASQTLVIARNTGMAHVRYGEKGPLIVDYNV